MSSFGHRPARTDALRNTERILDSAAELLATDTLTSLDRVAAHAHVSRTTLYHHFPGRDALLDALTDRSISEVCSALQSARPAEGEVVPDGVDLSTAVRV
ncbi:MAG: TetR/AcrR family transcriptional regulator [Solirubrobacteraceae bacterium]